MAKSKQEQRAEAVAVSDDAAQDNPKLWFRVGIWCKLLTADFTYYGRVSAITPTSVYMEEAAWIAQDGRASAFVRDPLVANEVEYLGDVCIERPFVAVQRTKWDGVWDAGQPLVTTGE